MYALNGEIRLFLAFYFVVTVVAFSGQVNVARRVLAIGLKHRQDVMKRRRAAQLLQSAVTSNTHDSESRWKVSKFPDMGPNFGGLGKTSLQLDILVPKNRYFSTCFQVSPNERNKTTQRQ